jgi:hypothetical protein
MGDAQNLDHSMTEIPEEEQWRLVNESGILGKVSSTPRKQVPNDEDEPTILAEEIFSAALLIIPFSFLLLMMEMFVLLFSRESNVDQAFGRAD